MTPWYLVLVTGSRNVGEAARATVHDRLHKHQQEAKRLGMLCVLVHGACRHPVDENGKRIPGRYSVDWIAHMMDGWDQVIAMPIPKGRRDGKPRNENMCFLVDSVVSYNRGLTGVCASFPPKGRFQSGSRNCMRFAREYGLTVESEEVE